MSQSQHIIIVDDEAPAREMVGDYLKMHGFTVTLCEGGKSLRTAIEGGVPDLVVLDLMLPGRSGMDVLTEVRQARPALPIIALTALGEVEHRVADPDPDPGRPRGPVTGREHAVRKVGHPEQRAGRQLEPGQASAPVPSRWRRVSPT